MGSKDLSNLSQGEAFAVTFSRVPFKLVRTNRCTDKNLHRSTLRLHETGGTGRIFEQLSMQVWNLLFPVLITGSYTEDEP